LKGILELRDYVFASTRALHTNEGNLTKIILLCNVYFSVIMQVCLYYVHWWLLYM